MNSDDARGTAGEELSPSEQTIWLDHMLGHGSAYRMRAELIVRGGPTVDDVALACRRLVRRQPLLRAVYGPGPRRRLLDPDAVPVTIGPGEGESTGDPATGPLARFTVAPAPDGAVRVSLAAHHLVFDGSSRMVLARELAAILAGEPLPDRLAAVPLGAPPADRRAVIEAARDLWHRLGPDPLRLPGVGVGARTVSRARPHVAACDVPGDVRAGLVGLAKRASATPLHAVLAALGLLLRNLGNPRPVVGIAVDNRGPAAADLIGCAVGVLPVRLEPDPQGDAVANVAAAADRLRAHLPFAEVPARQLLADRAIGRLTAVDDFHRLTLSYQRVPSKPVRRGPVEITSLDAGTTSGAVAGLALHVLDDGHRFTLRLDADPAAWTPDGAAAFLRDLGAAVAEFAAGKVTANPLRTAHRDTVPRIEEAFAQVADRDPERIAVVEGATVRRYGELRAQSRAIAGALRAEGVRPGDGVGLIGSGGAQSITAMLGILLAGAHYIPMDPTHPALRRAEVIDRARPRLVLATDRVVLPETAPPVRRVGELAAAAPPAEEPAGRGHSDDVAYVIHTSGSTGTPKGVAATHRGIVELALAEGPCAIRNTDRVLLNASLAFDASVWEIWATLLNGGRLVVAPARPSVRELAEELENSAVTVCLLVPSMFALLVDHHLHTLRKLRMVVVGADVAPVRHVAAFLDGRPATRLCNAYGPTENGVISTVYDVTDRARPLAHASTVPIGNTVAGTSAYVLDDRLRPVRRGATGELWLGGARLAAGYLGEPGRTADRFVPDPFTTEPGARMYRTGDLARRLPDGTLEFAGRTDNEVKIRGHRVNLAEVERILTEDDAVAEAAAAVTGEGAARRLVGFVRARNGGVDPAALRRRCAQRAPAYLVPSELVPVAGLPRTPSGKVDRAALPSLAPPGTPPEEPVAEPARQADATTRTLAALWQARVTRPPEPDADFFDAGGDSLALLRLIEDIRQELGVDLAVEEVYETPLFGEIVRLVRGASHD